MNVWDTYTKVKIIGRGAHGIAILSKRKKDDTLVVVKELFASDHLSEDDRRVSLNEIHVLSMLRHPNIIAYYDSFSVDANGSLGGQNMLIIMEYADGGTLSEYISSQAIPLPEDEILQMFAQLCLAIHYIHTHMKILHRDLKTNNIFISGEGRSKILKIGDFGISKVMNAQTKAETSGHRAISVKRRMLSKHRNLNLKKLQVLSFARAAREYNEKSDIWALGCILYEMTARKRLFEASNLPALVLRIMKGAYDPIPSHFSTSLRDLIRTCVTKDPAARPTVSALVCTPFLQRFIIDAVMAGGHISQ
ncbi:kinase-like domain-containing protein [Cladochytrium replicatum]|nr:kinase-like domain-containing protein [Cladochytrium replicatum]